MKVKIIKTEIEYETLLKRVEVLMDAEPGTSEEEELELLGLLVEHYEKTYYPIGSPSPLSAIEFFMDQNNLTNADMAKYFGSPSKVSEVLNGKRSLSKTMIRKLAEGLRIPAEILLAETPASKITDMPNPSEQLCVAEENEPYGKKN